MTTWIVPGAALEGGLGWRIWYSQPGEADFRPEPVRVLLAQWPETTHEEWQLLPGLPGLNRRMGVLTVTLETPTPGAVYDIHIPEAQLSGPFRWRTLPDVVGAAGVPFLLASCFYRETDKEGSYAALASSCWHNPCSKERATGGITPSRASPSATARPSISGMRPSGGTKRSPAKGTPSAATTLSAIRAARSSAPTSERV